MHHENAVYGCLRGMLALAWRNPPLMKRHRNPPDCCRALILFLPALFLASPDQSRASETSSPGIVQKVPLGKKTLIPVNERQGNAVIYEEVLNGSAGKSSEIMISLSKQRCYLLLGGELAIDSPIASGRKEGWTPKGSFTVLEKDLNHKSNRYGDLVDGEGRVVRKNVTCGASGGTFRGAPMKYFLRITWEGVGMHAGFLPGYPASHGCIRLPREVAERLFKIVPTGTPVRVTD
jgi:lipoprotein-anchoring transpeptidase ErfK/SrfK